MFKEYLQEVKEAAIDSGVFDTTLCSLYIVFDDIPTRYNNLPSRKGNLMYGDKSIAEVYVSVIPKPKLRFYEESIHNSVGGFDVISTTEDKLYYMVGSWKYGYIPLQKQLSKYNPGSNYLAVYQEYLINLEGIHKEEYDDEFEESD